MNLPHHHSPLTQALGEKMPRQETFGQVAEVFRLLADPSRLQIYWLLCHCRECVINLSALVGMSSPAVSHHLKVLKAAGLITAQRDGKEVYYTAAATETAQTLHRMIEGLIDITCPGQEGETEKGR